MSQGSSSVFTPEQLICLRNQIMVFRTLKVSLSLTNLRSCHVMPLIKSRLRGRPHCHTSCSSVSRTRYFFIYINS